MSNTITVTVTVDAAAAVRAGRSVSGSTTQITLDLDQLTVDERALVAEVLHEHDGHYRLHSPHPTLSSHVNLWALGDPTPEGLRAAIAETILARAAEAAAREQQQRERIASYHADALAVLAERRTKPGAARWATAGTSSVRYETIIADWPYYADHDPEDPQRSPEGQAWMAELEAAAVRTREAAEAQAAAQEAARLARIEQEAAERAAWITAHGSERLRRMSQEGIECRAVYRDERLALERPGWQFERQVRGEATEARNVPESAFALLDEARVLEPTGKLVYWQIEHEHDEEACDGEDCERYDYQGYAAIATYLDREIMYGVPAEYAI